MCFSEANESEEHVRRLEKLTDATTTTIDMAIYVITHPRLVAAIIRAHRDRGVVVRVITGKTLMKYKGPLVLSLIDAGVKMWVHQRKSYMLHDKYLVLDRSVVIHGSVN